MCSGLDQIKGLTHGPLHVDVDDICIKLDLFCLNSKLDISFIEKKSDLCVSFALISLDREHDSLSSHTLRK